MRTLANLGKVLTTFGEDYKIPAYGFGAKAASTGPLPYMFALDSEGGQLELDTIDVRFLKQTFCINSTLYRFLL